MKRKLLLLAVSAALLAAEEIVGGFGLRLGDTLDKKELSVGQEVRKGELLYEVDPPKKVKYFQKYYVMITPLSHRVREIWGVGYFTSPEECQNNMAVLTLIMEKKYGKFDKPDYATEQVMVRQEGDRRIVLKCTKSIGGADLYLRYVDEALNRQSMMERAEIEARSIDASAL